MYYFFFFFFFQAEDGIRDIGVTGVQTCALPISNKSARKTIEPQKAQTQAEHIANKSKIPKSF